MGEQPGVLALPRRVAAPTPRVKPTARDVQHPTQHLHGMGGLLHLDEPISQVDSLAKKAIAFFKMSRSCRTWSSSRRTALSSSVARKPFVPSGILAACRFHRLNVVCPIPSSRATCVQVLPLCRSSSTASCLNSAVNVWRDLPMSHLLLAMMPGRCPQIQGKTTQPQPEGLGRGVEGLGSKMPKAKQGRLRLPQGTVLRQGLASCHCLKAMWNLSKRGLMEVLVKRKLKRL